MMDTETLEKVATLGCHFEMLPTDEARYSALSGMLIFYCLEKIEPSRREQWLDELHHLVLSATRDKNFVRAFNSEGCAGNA